MSDIRGNRMAMIFQEPMTSLNPAYTIGNQLEEALLRHKRVSRRQARERAVYLLERVGITAAGSRLKQYPHQLSGGLRQRVMIAMALMCGPALILADEPTTALDVTIQAQILHLLAELQREFAMGLVLITHDLGIVARIATRVVVMYAGEVVETGTAAAIFSHARASLHARAARLHPRARPHAARRAARHHPRHGARRWSASMRGCHFAGRCRYVIDACRTRARAARRGASGTAISCAASAMPRLPPAPPCAQPGRRMTAAAAIAARRRAPPMLEARDVSRTFRVSAGLFKPQAHAARRRRREPRRPARARWWRWSASPAAARPRWRACCSGLLPPTAGEIRIGGQPIADAGRAAQIAALVQPVFQDPYSSLNPRKSIGSIIALPLRVQGGSDSADLAPPRRGDDGARRPGAQRCYDNYPSQLSGGQRQRVAIARALINRPRLVICDEPTSALDVSVQSQILNLLQDLRRDLGLTYLLISHNLAVVEHMATRVAVMYLGRIVEEADTDTLFRAPKHPYTQALLASVLTPEPGLGVPDTQLGAAYPNPLDVPPGCRFHPRCARVMAMLPDASRRKPIASGRRLRRMPSLRCRRSSQAT